MASSIIEKSDQLQSLTELELLARGRDMAWQAKTGVPLQKLLVDVYALVREASRRTKGLSHYPVQIMGAIALFEGGIAEMQTGEGKTLTAVMPAVLRALTGRGCHVVTVNDYLAQRDAEIMSPIYRALGLTVGCIQTSSTPEERLDAYTQDITYGTAKEMGFDFLRDRLKLGIGIDRRAGRKRLLPETSGSETLVQRELYFALIDEADSILIDEARTPLIIGLQQLQDPSIVNLYRWSQRVVRRLEPVADYIYEPKRRSAYLTNRGCRHILTMPKSSLIDSIDTERIYKHVEQALTAQHGFHLNRDYVVVDHKIVIVDESTGRMMEGRTWQDGLHQAIEAKEAIPITAANGSAARVTVQTFYRQYQYLAGMTGTAVQSRKEFRKSYRRQVNVIPTNRDCIRKGKPPRIFMTLDDKWNAVADEVERLQRSQCAILIGTPSVEASLGLKMKLDQRKVPHQILNAIHHEEEADIVKQAGRPGKVTVATNMAGRGTDIILEDIVKENGGLHVIATEMHSSTRIDRQLVGRAARQGDPGCYQFFLSLEDELFRCLEPEKRAKKSRKASPQANGELPRAWLRYFKKTQRHLEKTHYRQRKNLQKQEVHRRDVHTKIGLDPYLEMTD